MVSKPKCAGKAVAPDACSGAVLKRRAQSSIEQRTEQPPADQVSGVLGGTCQRDPWKKSCSLFTCEMEKTIASHCLEIFTALRLSC